MVKWPFKGLSDLQLGDTKVTLNHLIFLINLLVNPNFKRMVGLFGKRPFVELIDLRLGLFLGGIFHQKFPHRREIPWKVLCMRILMWWCLPDVVFSDINMYIYIYLYICFAKKLAELKMKKWILYEASKKCDVLCWWQTVYTNETKKWRQWNKIIFRFSIFRQCFLHTTG